jgi:hypothetical protein
MTYLQKKARKYDVITIIFYYLLFTQSEDDDEDDDDVGDDDDDDVDGVDDREGDVRRDDNIVDMESLSSYSSEPERNFEMGER